jgi:hypothetical protein
MDRFVASIRGEYEVALGGAGRIAGR